MQILLTNDDSHRSPFLGFVIEKLAALGELTIVVPEHEQSWKGKAMTRFGYLHKNQRVISGHPAYTIDGTPADCINVGVYHLCPRKPDLIVSGINAGLNTGIGFLFSSGTVGACLEGNIAQVPAVALSQCLDSATRNQYLADYTLAAETLARLRIQTRALLDLLFSRLLAHRALLQDPITWNVNFPFALKGEMRFTPAALAHTRYESCFQLVDDRFSHSLGELTQDPRSTSDMPLVLNGYATITPLDLRHFGQIETADHEALVTLFR